jgi:hypothetical protein
LANAGVNNVVFSHASTGGHRLAQRVLCPTDLQQVHRAGGTTLRANVPGVGQTRIRVALAGITDTRGPTEIGHVRRHTARGRNVEKRRISCVLHQIAGE